MKRKHANRDTAGFTEIGSTEQVFGNDVTGTQGEILAEHLKLEIDSQVGHLQNDEGKVSPNHRRVIARDMLVTFLNQVFRANGLPGYLPTIIYERHDEDPDLPQNTGPIISARDQGPLQDIKNLLERKGRRGSDLYRHVTNALQRGASSSDVLVAPVIILQDLCAFPNLEGKIEDYLTKQFDPKTWYEFLKKEGREKEYWYLMADEVADPRFKQEIMKLLRLWEEGKTPVLRLREKLKEKPLEAEGLEEADPVWTLFAVCVLHGVLHEVFHHVVLPSELSERCDQIMDRTKISQMIRIVFKNRTKSAGEARDYRKKKNLAEPTAESDAVRVRSYRTEMRCDLLPIFFLAQAGMSHVYRDYFDVDLRGSEIEAFFIDVLKYLQEKDSKGMSQIYTLAELLNSRSPQNFLSALSTPMERT